MELASPGKSGRRHAPQRFLCNSLGTWVLVIVTRTVAYPDSLSELPSLGLQTTQLSSHVYFAT